jgi:hypothetical protein
MHSLFAAAGHLTDQNQQILARILMENTSLSTSEMGQGSSHSFVCFTIGLKYSPKHLVSGTVIRGTPNTPKHGW